MMDKKDQETICKIMNNILFSVERLDDQPCWLWDMSCTTGGYGQLFYRGRNSYSHRVAYELLKGPIPEGLQLDHLCRNRSCCNPAHLEPVTSRENSLRGMCYEILRAKTHCKHGHEFTPENTRRHKNGGGRYCRICSNAASMERKRRMRDRKKNAVLHKYE